MSFCCTDIQYVCFQTYQITIYDILRYKYYSGFRLRIRLIPISEGRSVPLWSKQPCARAFCTATVKHMPRIQIWAPRSPSEVALVLFSPTNKFKLSSPFCDCIHKLLKAIFTKSICALLFVRKTLEPAFLG